MSQANGLDKILPGEENVGMPMATCKLIPGKENYVADALSRTKIENINQ